MSKITHLCVPIDRALEELREGNNIFRGSITEAYNCLIRAREKGYIYYTWCDSIDPEGRCAGHDVKENTPEARMITREEADRIIESQKDGPVDQVTICYGGKWYDIRYMSEKERWEFVQKLIN